MTLAYKLPEECDAAYMAKIKPDLEVLAVAKGNVTLDMSSVEFIDSSGIGGIVFLYKRLVASGYRLQVSGARDQPLHLLTHLRLAEILGAGAKL